MKKLLFLFVFLFVFACKDDIDDSVLVTTTENLEIEDFIYKVMNYWYLWQEDVPNLADNRFSNDKEYTAFYNHLMDLKSCLIAYRLSKINTVISLTIMLLS